MPLGRDGETKEDLLMWFKRHGWPIYNCGLKKLTAQELDILISNITEYGREAERRGEQVRQ